MSAGLDLAWDDAQLAIQDALVKFCRERCDADVVRRAAGGLPRGLWRGLAALAVLELASPDDGAGALELAAAHETLGEWVFPGPLCETVLAVRLLPPPERERVAAGELLATAGVPPLLPFAAEADLFLVIEGDAVRRARPAGRVTPLESLGGEPFGRVELEPGEALPGASAGLALADLALAAYLVGAGRSLLRVAVDHARTRVQFGRAIGEFQAVAHPLADCHMALEGAGALARAAAFETDARGARAAVLCGAARLSARRAALATAHAAHQALGALSITLEGPAFHVSRRIRQLASRAPGMGPQQERLLAHFAPPQEEPHER